MLANGHVTCATTVRHTGIGSVDPSNGKITDYPIDELLVTNICFGGDDMRDAWITLGTSGRLIRTRWDSPGLKLAHYA